MLGTAVGPHSQVLTKALEHKKALKEVPWVSLLHPTPPYTAGRYSLVEEVEANAIVPLTDDIVAEGR